MDRVGSPQKDDANAAGVYKECQDKLAAYTYEDLQKKYAGFNAEQVKKLADNVN